MLFRSKQKIVARKIAESLKTSTPKPAIDIMAEAGYGRNRRHPKRIIESEGVKEELKAILSIEETDNVVRSIMMASEKDSDRIKASDLIYKRTGAYAPTKAEIKQETTELVEANIDLDSMAEMLAEELKKKKI